jgi:hypothetical protein
MNRYWTSVFVGTLAFAFATTLAHAQSTIVTKTLGDSVDKTDTYKTLSEGQDQTGVGVPPLKKVKTNPGYYVKAPAPVNGIDPVPLPTDYIGIPSKTYKPDADKLTRPKSLAEAEAQIAALVEARIVDKITADIKCSTEKKQIIKALRNHQNVNYADNAPAEANGGLGASHPNTLTNPNTQTPGSVLPKLPVKANN